MIPRDDETPLSYRQFAHMLSEEEDYLRFEQLLWTARARLKEHFNEVRCFHVGSSTSGVGNDIDIVFTAPEMTRAWVEQADRSYIEDFRALYPIAAELDVIFNPPKFFHIRYQWRQHRVIELLF